MAHILSANVKDRTRGIGGSDIHHLLNAEPWGCSRQLWYEKTGTKPDYPFYGNNATQRGNDLEALAAQMYAEKTKRKLRIINTAFSRGGCAVGNIDRQIIGTGRETPGVLEIKVPGSFSLKKIKREGLPEAYTYKLQHYLYITGWEWGAFCILDLDNWDIIQYDVERDDELIDLIEANGKSFWEMVKTGADIDTWSARLRPSDNRCQSCSYRTKCQGAFMLSKCEEPEGEAITFDEDIAGLVAQYQEAKEQEKEAAAYKEGVRTVLEEAMGNRSSVTTIGAKVVFRPVITKRLDGKSLKNDCPKIYERYRKESISRPLKVYPF